MWSNVKEKKKVKTARQTSRKKSGTKRSRKRGRGVFRTGGSAKGEPRRRGKKKRNNPKAKKGVEGKTRGKKGAQ